MELSTPIRCEQLQAQPSITQNSQNSLNLSAASGSVINIIGPGHTGKSDWLKAISGIDELQSGELWLLDKNVRDFNANDWVHARTQLAYVHAETSLLSAANTLQNMMLPAVYHNLGSTDDIKQRALHILDEIDITCDLSILPAYLRKDQRYRIAVARALMLQPQALILDDPFSQLDLTAAKQFRRFLIDKVRLHNLLLITVTHDIKFALRYSDQILFMTEDKIYQFDKLNNISSSNMPEIQTFIDTEQ